MLKRTCLAICLFVVAVSSLSLGQSAELSGYVKDQTGAGIPKATVEIRNIDTGVRQQVLTNDQGLYTLPLLKPGKYAISVHAPGFKTLTRDQIALNVADRLALDFSVEVGMASEVVTVQGDAPTVSTSGSVGTTIDRTFVGNLPLNGRSFQSLILLAPGITVTATNAFEDGQFSVNGQRASTNYLTVDGVSANIGATINQGAGSTSASLAGAYPGLSAFGGTSNLVSVDALEEFKVQTSTYDAESGRQPGGQVSLVSRAGTNDFHGTLFEYLRNDALDSRDYFNKLPNAKPRLRQNIFGGTFSGPIVRNKAFFFFSYEGQRLRLPLSGVTNVPSLRIRSNAASALKPILNVFPQPTGAELLDSSGQPTGWAPYNYGVSNPGSLDAISIRLDHVTKDKLTLFGRYNESPSSNTAYAGSGFGGAYSSVNNSSTRTLTLGAISVLSPQLTNNFRFNYSRQFGQQLLEQTTNGGAVALDPQVFASGHEGTGQMVFSFGGNFGLIWAGDFVSNVQRQINLVDTAAFVRGNHQFRFGIDYRRIFPTYKIGDFQEIDFLSESSLNSAIADSVRIVSNDSANPRFNNFSAFVQDTWKASRRLSVDLGIRWEFNPPPTEANGKFPIIATGITGNPPDVSHASLAPSETVFYKTFYRAFAPRFGAAYLLHDRTGRETVLRGGFGIYYDLGSTGSSGGFPRSITKLLAAVPFPLSDADSTRPPVSVPTSLPITTVVYSSDPDLMLPYTLQWNVATEQSLGLRNSFSIRYVGSAARRLLTTSLANLRAGRTTGPRPNPNFNNIFYTWNGPTSDYHAMQVQYKSRVKDRFQSVVNYTWSHAIDEVSTDNGTNVLSRGNADFDVRHNLSAAIEYDCGSISISPLVGRVLSNWNVSGIVHAQSGMPVDIQATSPSTVVDGFGLFLRPDVVPGQPFYLSDPSAPGGRRFNPAAFTNPPVNPLFPNIRLQGNFGRNVLRGLPIYQLDAALGRNISIKEGLRLQLKGEVFNVLNHPMFAGYGLNFGIPATFGVPSSTLSRGLGGLGSLYQLGGPRSIQLSLKLNY